MPHNLRNDERRLVSIAHIITRGAEIHPQRIAIDDLLRQRKFTYAELNQRVIKLAKTLAQRGIAEGDMVATMHYNEHGAVESLMASALLGAIAVPINVRLLPSETAEYCNFHDCKAVVCAAEFTDKFAAANAALRITNLSADQPIDDQQQWLDYETLLEQITDISPLPVVTRWEDPFRMIQTGGTTGASKGVVHTHAGTYFTVLAVVAELGLQRNWQSLMVAPTYHGAGIDWCLLPVLWRGGTVIFPADTAFNPKAVLQLIREREIELMLFVPAMIVALAQVWDGEPVTCVRSGITASAPTPPALREKLAQIFPTADIRAGAGISESLNMAIQSPGEFLEHPLSIGEPCIDTRMVVVDENGRRVPAGTPGEICLRGFNTGLGYDRQPELTSQTWRLLTDDPEGLEWTFTGDIGVMDDTGKVAIIDRSKDVIISGGETIPSVEIESIYMAHPNIVECAAVGLADERWGEAIHLVAVLTGDAVDTQETARELYRWGREKLAGYKVPKAIVFMDALPRSHFGKVLKRDLRAASYPDALREIDV